MESKNIFIQVDTKNLGLQYLYNVAMGKGSLSKEDVLAHTSICKDGSTSFGTAVSDFMIDVKPGQKLYFTLIPSHLHTKEKLTFVYGEDKTPIKPVKPDAPVKFEALHHTPFSFGVKISDKQEDVGFEEFALGAQLELARDKVGFEPSSADPVIIPFVIDPKLQVSQPS